MTEINKTQNNLAKAVGLIIGGIILYFSGYVTYIAKNDLIVYPLPHGESLARTITRNMKIDELQKYIPFMKEPFASQYKDSLETILKERSEIDLEMDKLMREYKKKTEKVKYSWLAFFMEN